MWSAVIRSPSEVGGEVPSARFRGQFFACARGHPAYFKLGSFWKMREHVVISPWFGIVGPPFPSYAFPFWLQREDLLQHRLQPMEMFPQEGFFKHSFHLKEIF